MYPILEPNIWINSVTVIASLLGEAGNSWVLIWGDYLASEVSVDSWSHIQVMGGYQDTFGDDARKLDLTSTHKPFATP